MVLCHQPTRQKMERIAGMFGINHATFWTVYERLRAKLNEMAFDVLP
jgi:hypothetical protein